MIRYAVTPKKLNRLIDEWDARWRTRAAARTDTFRRARKYDEHASIWGDIKPVYMQLQHFKCAYCERRLEGSRNEDVDFGRIEHDVEHYRPKNSIVAWPTAKIGREREVSFTYPMGASWKPGYFLLAYSVFNYVVACKSCNSTLKNNYFPIAGSRGPQRDDPASLSDEQPYLPYPLGDSDDDPEEIITFRGHLPVARRKRGPRRRRADVTIRFFELDTRDTLLRERAEALRALGIALRQLSTERDPYWRAIAQRAVELLQSSASPHANCARAFAALYEQDPVQALELLGLARRYLDSGS